MQPVLLGRAWLPPAPSALGRQRQESCCKSEVSLGCRLSFRPDRVVESLRSKSAHTKLASSGVYQVHTNFFLKCVCVCWYVPGTWVCVRVCCLRACVCTGACMFLVPGNPGEGATLPWYWRAVSGHVVAGN